MKESKLIASVVVFKELHDSNKDIYDVISEFIKATIISNKKWKFNSTEITSLIENEFDFKLPEAVIKTTLKRRLIKSGFLILEHGEYNVTDINTSIDPTFETNYKKNIEIYNQTEQEFISYIQKSKGYTLDTSEKTRIKENLNQYLLGNGLNEDFSKEISTYIVKNKSNVELQKRLNVIKEGLVLYTGVRFTADINELGKWDKELTIFLDTEILFYSTGLNGEIYRDIFNDFYNLVREINNSSKKKIIHLKYFEETEKEVFDFFHVATLIIEGKKTLNPSKTAMKEIINGCTTKSDIVVKRNKFFIDLKTSGISKEESKDYYEDYSLNIEGSKVIEEIQNLSQENKKEFDEESCKQYLKLFTKVNVLRKGINNHGFENSKYLLLTGNRFVQFLAHSKHVKPNERDVPFATDIDYITDKFWFKLKKGFGGSDEKPKSFDIVTKAQIILSAQINNTVQEKFTALNDEYRKGNITKEEAISLNYELRESSLKPEEVIEIDIEEKIDFVNEFSIEQHLREREKLKQKVKEGEEAKQELKRRDRHDRTNAYKPIKSQLRFISFIVTLLLILVILGLLYSGYLIIDYLQEPGDSKLTIIGFVIGIIALLPIYKYGKLFLKYKRKRIKQSFKNKLKQPVPNNV